MAVLYVTSLELGAGKTSFCAGLARLLHHQGRRPALFKPLTLHAGYPDPDAAFFARLDGNAAPQGWPVAMSSQVTQQGLRPQTRTRLLAAFQGLVGQASDVIVEGLSLRAGQSDLQALSLDIAAALDARVVVIVRFSTSVHVEELLALARSLGPPFLGFVVNRVPRYRQAWAQTFLVTPLRQQGIPVLATLPEERCLLGVTVEHLASHLGGTFLCGQEKGEELVDHLLIGGWVLDWGVGYFQQSETKAVIVRGDRPDIQMAALHTPTRCLVLTGGHEPLQYVMHEAQEEGIPLILVQSDTLATANALESLFQEAPAHHPAKAECVARLLAQTLDPNVLQSIAIPC